MKLIMLALDCTPPSVKAIEYLADIAPHLPDVNVLLFSVATGIHLPQDQLALPDAGSDLPLEHQHEKAQIDAIHDYAEKRLIENGLAPDRISRRIKVISRGVGRDIVDEANALEVDTLAIGHRGMSKIKQLFIGSVSSKILNAGKHRAIWIIE